MKNLSQREWKYWKSPIGGGRDVRYGFLNRTVRIQPQAASKIQIFCIFNSCDFKSLGSLIQENCI